MTADEKEEPVAVIKRGKLRLGTAADAGALCITKDSPNGVNGEVYRYYMRELGAPRPYQVRDPITGAPVSARDDAGRELFDLDAVVAWNAGRSGPGWERRPDRPVKHTELRQQLIVGARDGQLRLARTGRSYLGADDDETTELRSRRLQRLGELVEAGLIRAPKGQAGKYTLTPAGRQWLTRHGVPDAVSQSEPEPEPDAASVSC